MDADRFDELTRTLGRRASRRAALGGLGLLLGAAVGFPARVRAQDDDATPVPEDDPDDRSDDDDSQPDEPDAERLGWSVCQDIKYCKRFHCIDMYNVDGSGDCHYDTIGDIPGGPYKQEWVWANFPDPCTPVGITERELEAMCNAAYPGDNCLHCCNNECEACATFSVLGCS